VNLKITNDVAILYSVDSGNGLDFMPIVAGRNAPWPAPTGAGVYEPALQFHRSLYQLNVGTDFVFADDPDFSRYKVLIVPALYVADDALLQKISDYVKGGGHVADDLQERIHEREQCGALGACAGAAARGGGLQLPGVFQPGKAAGAEGRSVSRRERRTR
jgi:hypothetical protein